MGDSYQARVLSSLACELSGISLPEIALQGSCETYAKSETLNYKHGNTGHGTFVLVHGNYFFPENGRPGQGNLTVRHERWIACPKRAAKRGVPEICHPVADNLSFALDESTDTAGIANRIRTYLTEKVEGADLRCKTCKLYKS